MPQEALFPRLFLHEDVSPVPLRKAKNGLDMPDSALPVRIGDLRATFDGPGLTPTIEWGDSWTTSKAAIEESFRTEFARVLEYARPLAARLRVAARDTSDSSGTDVAFEQPRTVHGRGRAARTGGHRLHRAVADAVRASGRQPSPFGSRVTDLEHWSATVDELFSPLPPASAEVLAVTYDFLPVLTEWLRADAMSSGAVRHLIRADLGLPAEAYAYRETVPRLRPAVRSTLSLLARGRQERRGDRMAGQRSMTQAVFALQDAFPRGQGRVELGIVFAENPGATGYVVPAVGLRIPAPRDGHALRLTDGTVARLSAPPWTMGSVWDPPGEEPDGEEPCGQQPQDEHHREERPRGRQRLRGWGRHSD
ncbi:hypothetical protein [Streptomyces liangshanensis]|uniref:Uncharacterized protein n=1 Tax=Streptomyces liangshanensis TaxID=2717324 RepID=A0A6G9H653_9ACTN|nr:hypothetical protein [Streptomyces liangshanensis]QIQ05577.1 hypothetical protein HA039_27715 [Streptomyces liangshanensis]